MNLYQYSVKFNATHTNTTIEYKHNHTFVASIYMKYDEHISYDVLEKDINKYFDKYRKAYINDFIEDASIENFTSVIFNDLDKILKEELLYKVVLSDSPVQKFSITRVVD